MTYRACQQSCGHPACAEYCQAFLPNNRPPDWVIKKGTIFYRPNNSKIRYRVVSPPYLRTYWDLRGKTEQERQFWQVVILFLTCDRRLPLHYIFGLPLVPTFHKENNWMLQDGSILLFFPYTYRVEKEVYTNGSWQKVAHYRQLTPRWMPETTRENS